MGADAMNTQLSEAARKLQLSVELVTPAIAAEWLERSRSLIRNRKIKDYAVQKVIRQLNERNWCINGESIILDDTGCVLDGQHRLTACIKSGIPIETVVVRGVSREAFRTIDTSVGGARQLDSWLQIDGYANSSALASAAGIAIRYEEGSLSLNHHSGENYSYDRIKAFIQANPSIQDAVSEASGAFRGDKTVSPRLVALAIFVLDRTGTDREVVREFLTSLTLGTGLDHGSPILATRRAFTSAKTNREIIPEADAVRMIFSAWNAWVQNETREHVKKTRRREGATPPTVPKPIRASRGHVNGAAVQ